MPSECLGTDVVVELVEGLLPADRRAAVDGHLSTCSDCRLLVAEVARDDAHETVRRVLVPGDKVGRFPITGLRGRGSMGVVYEAYDPELHRPVALKLVGLETHAEDAERLRARLLREARGLAKVSHPNVVAVFEVGEHRGEVYIAMELIDGLTLRTWLEVEPRAVSEITALLSAAASGLAAAHRAGLVHRDVKPDNILVTRDGTARVVDFGLVQPAGSRDLPAHPEAQRSRLTATDVAVGTPAYMLFEALYGEHPFTGETSSALLESIAEGPRTPPGGRTSTRVQRAIARGLSRAPEDRFESMQDLLHELTPPARRRVWPVAAALGLVLGLLALGATSRLRPEPCEAGAELSEQIGSVEGATRARSGAAASGEPSRGEAFSALDAALAGYRTRWAASHRRVCRASRVHGHQSDEALDRRMLCLDQLRRRAEVVGASGVAVRSASDVDGTLQAALQLPDPGGCEVMEGVALPTDASRRERYRALQLELATARAELDLLQLDEGTARATAALREARLLDDAGLRAQARLVMARGDIERGATESSEAHLRAGMKLAATAKDDELLARLSVSLVESLFQQARYDTAVEVAKTAEVLVLRGGDAPLLRSRLLRFLSIAQSWELENAASTASIRRAITLSKTAGEVGRPELVANLTVLANHLVEIEGGSSAESAAEAAYQEARALYGRGHPRTNEARFYLGAAQVVSGGGEPGLRRMRAALDHDVQTRGQHPTHAYAYTLLGEVLARSGDCASALDEYARAAKVAEQAFGPGDYMVAMVLRSIAACDGGDVRALLERSLEIRRATRGREHEATSRVELDLVHLDLEVGEVESADRRLRRIESAVTARANPESLARWSSLSAWAAYQRGECDRGDRLRAEAKILRAGTIMSWPAVELAGPERWSCEGRSGGGARPPRSKK